MLEISGNHLQQPSVEKRALFKVLSNWVLNICNRELPLCNLPKSAVHLMVKDLFSYIWTDVSLKQLVPISSSPVAMQPHEGSIFIFSITIFLGIGKLWLAHPWTFPSKTQILQLFFLCQFSSLLRTWLELCWTLSIIFVQSLLITGGIKTGHRITDMA